MVVMNRIINILLYGGIGKDMYAKIRSTVSSDNKKSIRLVTGVGAFAFAFAGAMSDNGNVGIPKNAYYFVTAILLLVLLINELLTKKYPIISDILVFIYSEIVLMMGALMAYKQYTERATLLLPFFPLVAMVFCYRPIYLLPIELIPEIICLLLLKTVQESNLYFVNKVNTILFCMTGIVGGVSILRSKYKKYEVEYNNHILLERDTLTGIYNRLSYSLAIDDISKNNISVTICSFDVNGLKKCNDTKGHSAGDELIIGAAKCLQDVFEPYGDVYRTGGDEFCALLYKVFDEKELRQKLFDKTQTWESKFGSELKIACGMAKYDCKIKTSVNEAIHKADMQMYEEKRAYYQIHDRRTNKSH